MSPTFILNVRSSGRTLLACHEHGTKQTGTSHTNHRTIEKRRGRSCEHFYTALINFLRPCRYQFESDFQFFLLVRAPDQHSALRIGQTERRASEIGLKFFQRFDCGKCGTTRARQQPNNSPTKAEPRVTCFVFICASTFLSN